MFLVDGDLGELFCESDVKGGILKVSAGFVSHPHLARVFFIRISLDVKVRYHISYCSHSTGGHLVDGHTVGKLFCDDYHGCFVDKTDIRSHDVLVNHTDNTQQFT